jgi:hypothetical protein
MTESNGRTFATARSNIDQGARYGRGGANGNGGSAHHRMV